jgi:lysyl-tRNA synthetase class 2
LKSSSLLFIGGVELANAFDELIDPVEQRARFQEDLRVRRARGAQEPPIDERLLDALPALGDCVGIALGFDRLVMLLCGAAEIDEVRLQSWLEA